MNDHFEKRVMPKATVLIVPFTMRFDFIVFFSHINIGFAEFPPRRRSPTSAALLKMHSLMGFAGWQWMFVLEVIPAMVFSIAWLFFATDRQAKAK